MSKYFEAIRINGITHRVSALAYSGYDDSVKMLMVSFMYKQEHDNLLASIQKGEVFYCNGDRVYTTPKVYVSNISRCKDDNKGDGYHAVIYADEEDVIYVQQGEDKLDKIYQYLLKFKSGILPEWKQYYYDTLVSLNKLGVAKGFDNTGYMPEIYLDRGIDTELIRNIKAEGLKTGAIVLDVPILEKLDPSMEFLNIIENIIIPNIRNEEAYYNIGKDKINPIFSMPIKKGNKVMSLIPKQQILVQGMLNYLEDNHDTAIINGGTGVGKTWMTTLLSYAITQELLKKKDCYIGIMCQATLINNWTKAFKECLTLNGIIPKIITITNYADINKLPKEPKGLNIVIMSRDLIKMQYVKRHCGSFKHPEIKDVVEYVKSLGRTDKCIEFKNCKAFEKVKKDDKEDDKEPSRLGRIRLAVARYSNQTGTPIALYRLDKDLDGKKCYRITTNCKALLKKYGSVHKYYDFTSYNLTEVKDFINRHKDEIKNQKILLRADSRIDMNRNYIVCPKCGGKIYTNKKHKLDPDKTEKYLTVPFEKDPCGKYSVCNNYVKADGTTITDEEFEYIIARKNYIIVDKPTKEVYLDTSENPLTGKDLADAKLLKDEISFIMRIKLCNHSMFGYEETKGRRCVNAGKYVRKIHGDKFFDVCIFDEFHELKGVSQQGETMGYLCKASKFNLLLSGTISEGKASDLYYVLWRTNPRKMKEMGYDYEDEKPFVQHYGRMQRKSYISADDDYSSTSSGIGKVKKRDWDEIAGISPLLYNNFLVGCMASRKIEDMGFPLPNIKYIKEEVEMTTELKMGYEKLKNDMKNFLLANKKVSLGGSYVQRLKSYSDMPNQEDVYATVNSKFNKKDKEKIYVCTPTHFDLDNMILPKEKRLIATLTKELHHNRKAIVYTEATGVLGVAGRLYKLLSKYFKVKFLASSGTDIKKSPFASKVANQNRETTIEQWAREGVEVIICNPTLVKTGLNLMDFPTLYFYDQPYTISTLRQAEMRSYRPFQKRECRVYYAFYKECIQEDAIKLIGSKKKAALALEGVFSNDMISSMADGGDTVESMLNKILDGRYTIKEDELDMMDFDTVDYTIEEKVEEDTIIDVKYEEVKPKETKPKTTTVQPKEQKPKEKKKGSSMFVFDNKFREKVGLPKVKEDKNDKEVAATTEQLSMF